MSEKGKPKISDYEKARAQLKLSAKIRGRYLDYAVTIERTVDGIISTLLCPRPVMWRRNPCQGRPEVSWIQRNPEQAQRFNLIYSFLTKRDLRSKILFLGETLRLLEPGLPESTRKWICDQLNEMREFRNRIAHSQLDLTGKWLKKNCNDRIRLIFYCGGEARIRDITMEEVERRIGGLEKLYVTLFSIETLVGKGMTPSEWRNTLRAVAPPHVPRT